MLLVVYNISNTDDHMSPTTFLILIDLESASDIANLQENGAKGKTLS